MSKIVIIESSLNKRSKSERLAKEAYAHLNKEETTLISLGEYNLPLCDGGSVYADPNVQKLTQELESAKGVLIATPIYNYTINSALKTAIECTGKKGWENKTVGFLVAAGGAGSYMAIMGIANSLMLDFRCVIIPRFVYAKPDDFENGDLISEEIKTRVKELSDEMVRFTSAL